MILQRAVKRHSIPYLFRWGFQRSLGLLTSEMRVLPDFIIIGAQRCGTTSLFNYLSHHPDIYPSTPKEVHFFSNHYRKGVIWYRSHFPLASNKRHVIRSKGRSFMAAEATPYYLSHPHAPRRIFEVLPESRFIVLLRNPVDRAYSHYQYEVKMGFETLSFEQALVKEAERLSNEVERMAADEDYRSFNHQHYSYLSRGIYVDQLSEWVKYIQLDLMLILKSEDFYEEPENALRQVTQFLGLPDLELDEYKKYNYAIYHQMEPETRKKLIDYFEPHNQRLSDFLGQDLGWNR